MWRGVSLYFFKTNKAKVENNNSKKKNIPHHLVCFTFSLIGSRSYMFPGKSSPSITFRCNVSSGCSDSRNDIAYFCCLTMSEAPSLYSQACSHPQISSDTLIQTWITLIIEFSDELQRLGSSGCVMFLDFSQSRLLTSSEQTDVMIWYLMVW